MNTRNIYLPRSLYIHLSSYRSLNSKIYYKYHYQSHSQEACTFYHCAVHHIKLGLALDWVIPTIGNYKSDLHVIERESPTHINSGFVSLYHHQYSYNIASVYSHWVYSIMVLLRMKLISYLTTVSPRINRSPVTVVICSAMQKHRALHCITRHHILIDVASFKRQMH